MLYIPVAAAPGAADNDDDSDDSDDDSGEDDAMELPTGIQPSTALRTRRCSVSAESAVAQDTFVPTVIGKSEEQRKHILGIIKDNILFAHLDENQMKIVMDALAPGLRHICLTSDFQSSKSAYFRS